VSGPDLDRARHIALTILQHQVAPTTEDLDRALEGAIAAAAALGDTIDRDQLRRRLEADISVFVGDASVLADNDANHRPWLDARRAEIEWRFWDAYRDWSVRRMPPEVIRRLHHMTDDILGRLEDPDRDGRWDRRGMVVGQVQSGKTSNYTALICKAADAGYNFIVVLAGLHNSLRSQTQGRLDEGFLGLDSRLSLTGSGTRAIGVGSGGRRHPAALTLTSSEERGDFAKGVASRVAGRMDADSSPVILVVKKHRTILNNLIEWVTSINGQADPRTGRLVVSRFPLFVIDDEADNASVNTKQIEREFGAEGELLSETDPSVINKQIRRLLHSFDRSALVSYTATPFANIFIDEEQPSRDYGEDLFPRSFILRIPPPTNYVGPAEVFGVPAAEDPHGIERPGLPVLRTLADNEDWLATGHKSDAAPRRLPTSLKEAIRAFLLVCAARAARGQINVHTSMLVHVTRYVAVQSQVRDQIQAELDALKDRLVYGSTAADELLDELRRLWEDDFEPTFARMPADLRGAAIDWDEVAALLPAAAGRVNVLEINGTARDALTYSDHPDGISVIAVGGDKLSRGLTLEGLSVSYYLRASKMYDTLMQMGRWFGYRDGYNDLVRLYTTAELQEWYRDITVANEELGAKFDEMARVGSNPRDFSLYVRKSPAGLLVTAQAKMRSGRSMELTFSGDVVETIGFQREPASQLENLATMEHFLRTQTSGGRRSRGGADRHPIWTGVTGDDVASVLEAFTTVDRAKKARGRLLALYVRSRLRHSELTDWTVVLINNSSPTAPDVQLADESIGLTLRSYYKAGRDPSDTSALEGDYTIRRLGDPGHEILDLSDEERARAELLRAAAEADAIQRAIELDLDPKKIKAPAVGPFARRIRPVTRGLLVVYLLNPAPADMPGPVPAIPGFLISFPESPGAPTITYVVPRRYWEQEAA
jgi:hypothetical protein